jgi:hypothetical protein
MNHFLLTIFGKIESREVVNDIADLVRPIVYSKHIKYQFSKSVLILHFESDYQHNEVHLYLSEIADDLGFTFILTEVSEKVSVHMPKEFAEHLFNLDSNDDEEQEEDDNISVIDSIKSNITKPSLDSLLDKIGDKGVNSLSQYEKDVLKEYSINK